MNKWITPLVICFLAIALFVARPVIASTPFQESDPSIGTGGNCQIIVSQYANNGEGVKVSCSNWPGGHACTQDSDCKSSNCDCRRTGSQLRCCNGANNDACTSNSDCQSYNCVSGSCKDNPNTSDDDRPATYPCDVNEDCHSGKCVPNTANHNKLWCQ